MTLQDLLDSFELLGDWEERYKFVIDLGKQLEPLPAALRTDATQVRGCMSQVWLAGEQRGAALHFWGDSDALLVRGLVALLLILVNDKTPAEILQMDVARAFQQLGLEQHITANRRNGFFSMVERIRETACAAA